MVEPFKFQDFRDASALNTSIVDDLRRKWANDIARGMDQIIGEAITRALGRMPYLEALTDRLQSVRYQGQTFETIYLDGKPILELHDLTFSSAIEDGAYKLRADRNYRFLGDATPTPSTLPIQE